MKIIFMGTPEFAVAALKALIHAGHDILAVITQPDKPKGRSKELIYPPVKECALEHGIEVLQPRRVKAPESVAKLKEYGADVFVVAAFGQILSSDLLTMPPYGCLNIHASLLPKYRGAAPIQHTILNGEEKTGITIMQMDEGIDTGDMLYKREISIEKRDTSSTLHDKLMVEGGRAIVEALELLTEGKLVPEKQPDEESCYAPKIEKAMGEIDFQNNARMIERKIRAMTPWPGAYTWYRGKLFKIWEGEASHLQEALHPQEASHLQEALHPQEASHLQEILHPQDAESHTLPGEIIRVSKDSVWIACGAGTLKINSLQIEGKKRMSVREFLLGADIQIGEILSK